MGPELYKLLLFEMVEEEEGKHSFRLNLAKIVIRVLFCYTVSMSDDGDDPTHLALVRKVVIEGIYKSLTAQILLANLFRQNGGAIQR